MINRPPPTPHLTQLKSRPCAKEDIFPFLISSYRNICYISNVDDWIIQYTVLTAVKSLKHQLSEMFGQTFTSLYVEFIMSCIRADYFFNFCHFSAGFVLFLKLQGVLYNYVNVHAYRICGFLLHIYVFRWFTCDVLVPFNFHSVYVWFCDMIHVKKISIDVCNFCAVQVYQYVPFLHL